MVTSSPMTVTSGRLMEQEIITLIINNLVIAINNKIYQFLLHSTYISTIIMTKYINNQGHVGACIKVNLLQKLISLQHT